MTRKCPWNARLRQLLDWRVRSGAPFCASAPVVFPPLGGTNWSGALAMGYSRTPTTADGTADRTAGRPHTAPQVANGRVCRQTAARVAKSQKMPQRRPVWKSSAARANALVGAIFSPAPPRSDTAAVSSEKHERGGTLVIETNGQ